MRFSTADRFDSGQKHETHGANSASRFCFCFWRIGRGGGFYFKAAGNKLPLNVITALKVPSGKRSEAQKKEIEHYYLGISPALADSRTKITAAEQEKAGLQKNLPRTLVSVSMKPRDIRILPRGNWLDDSGEIVQPAIPKFLGKLETGDKRATRLDLANWLISAENPMTSRTFVNRLWKLFFGNGLAKNVNDLGSQGQWPSHPLPTGRFLRSAGPP
jgi:hypothetical protein